MTTRNWLLLALFTIGLIVSIAGMFRKVEIDTEKDPELAAKYISLSRKYNLLSACLFIALILMEIDPLLKN